jgi:DNA helicase-2/ATP-dependent DNA helicase PcrA
VTYVPSGTQNDVIASDAAVTVVVGGAGTGKTVTAAVAAGAHLVAADTDRDRRRHAMLLRGRLTGLPPRARALFLSFSRTAVAQVIDRAATAIGPLIQRIEVVTFHGFAWRVINDFGGAYGQSTSLEILSDAENRVAGTPPGMTYDDLIPGALSLLGKSTPRTYYSRRYSLVICDEFQDTDDEEWRLLQAIAPNARRILLGDANQCIYADMKGIDPDARIGAALELPGAMRIDLPAASHRDPSGVLPAAADAARERRFDDPALAHAAASGRMVATRATDEMRDTVVVNLVKSARESRQTVCVFTHSNVATAALSDALTAAATRHEQVGLSEAYGEALTAQLALLRYALQGISGRRALAVFVAANFRRNDPLIGQIVGGTNPEIEQALAGVIGDLRAAAKPLDVNRLARVIADAYARLGALRGQSTWSEAARRTRTAMRLLDAGKPLSAVEEELMVVRRRALLGDAPLRPHPVQVMNLHQTKGREADVTILVLQPGEYHGEEGPPYPKLSRLLYVLLTRARHQAHIIVPDNVHPLWQPLVKTCEVTSDGRRSALN